MKIGNKEFDCKNGIYVCGILNVTPDSFSDGGSYTQLDQALFHVEQMLEDGMDLLDVGGESTRPGYQQISYTEEIERVAPVIAAVKERFDVPVSIDTYKAKVGFAAVQAGADMVNDIWGLKYDPSMAKMIADMNVACCLMHNRNNLVYRDFFSDVVQDLQGTLALSKAAGIERDKIILDPGIGFGKSVEQNLQLTNHLEIIMSLGYPVLLGTSRKSMIGKTLDLPVDEREEGTLVTTVLAVQKRCSFVRVHNVKANVRAIRMLQAIMNS